MFVEQRGFNAETVLKFQIFVVFLMAESLQGLATIVEDPAIAPVVKLLSETINTSNETDSLPSEFPRLSNNSQLHGPLIIDLNDFKNDVYQNVTDVINTINQRINITRREKQLANTTVIRIRPLTDTPFLNQTEPDEKTISNVYVYHNVNVNSYLTTLCLVGFGLLSCTIYLALIIYRKYLESTYGSRDLLVECDDLQQNDDIEIN